MKLRKLKHLLLVGALALLGNACQQNDNPNGLYDWDVTRNVIDCSTGKIDSQSHSIEYQKTEAYMIKLKADFNRGSTKFFRCQLIYKKRP